MIKQSEINEAWRIFGEKTVEKATYANFDAAISEAVGVEPDVPVLEDEALLHNPDPDDETNPFGEEVDDFDKEELDETPVEGDEFEE